MPRGRRRGRPPIENVAQGERRAEIIAAARELFGQRGYAAVSLGQIAEEVGVTKAALYNHFANKEALFTEAACSLMDRIAEAIQRWGAAPGTTSERLRQIAEFALLRVTIRSNMDELMRDVAMHLSPEQQAQVSQSHQRMLTAIASLMEQGIAAGELRADLPPQFLAYSFQRLLSSFQGVRAANVSLPPAEQVVDLLITLFMEGARPAP